MDITGVEKMGKAYCKQCNREVDYKIIPIMQQAYFWTSMLIMTAYKGVAPDADRRCTPLMFVTK